MKQVNLKRTPAEKKAEESRHKEMGYSNPPKAHDYPQGLIINIGEGELDKLGIKTLPKADTEVNFTGRGRVVTVHSEAVSGKDPTERLEVQITHMGIATKTPTAADTMYPDAGSDGE
jgi:hypothetical protein